ncbi:DNA-binding transcriptional regulator, LysR family [Rhizobiales bacterium GAS188]|nr:DNA-binding transcriptional regulator, LysR family [Rhizobiales bacterium GAS188]
MASLDDYSAFVAVVNEGSLTAAARRLSRSLQSVSRSLAGLEGELQVELITRTTRRSRPTPAGLAYAARLRPALADIELARDELLASDRRLAGKVRIGASSLFGQEYVVPALTTFLERNREVEIELKLADQHVDLLSEGLDLAVRIGVLPDSDLRARRLGGLRWAFFGAPAYLSARGRPLEPRDLERHECILRAGSGPESWSFGRDGLRLEVRGRFRSDSASARNMAAAQGFGIVLAPLWQVRRLLDEGRIELVLAGYEPEPIPLAIVWPASLAMPRRVRAVIDVLAERLSQLRL